MSKHTKPFTESDIKRALQQAPDDSYDEYAALKKWNEQQPDNRRSRIFGIVFVVLLSAIFITALVGLVMLRYGVVR